jgi:Type IV secretion-system coupling protein DNA-binding domain
MMLSTLRKFVGLKPRSYTLSVPRIEENEGLLALGDTGTGKTQVIHQLLDSIAKRKPQEAVVVYDPAGEFIEKHFDPDEDIVLNPLDVRCPRWSPCYEYGGERDASSLTARQFIADSFFPNPDHLAANAQFFIKAARSIFAQMLQFNPPPERIVEMLSEDDLIDYCVAGTEHAHLIDRDAKGQRGGVLATLSEIGESFKLLPTEEDSPKRWISFEKWARHRKGWMFITSTQTTREPLRRLHAAWINILLRQLLTSYSAVCQRPCWVIIDEVHSLKHLPVLETTLVEARKYGVKMVLGTQNKAQFEEHYGRAAATMLASSHTKILFRCNEPESARWVSEMIGEEEKERPRIGTTATVDANGRDSINYSTFTERRLVVSKEQIMALPNLHGYWKYADSVVPFRIEPKDRPTVAQPFIPRPPKPVVEKEIKERALKLVPPVSNGGSNGGGQGESKITTRMIDDIDTGF